MATTTSHNKKSSSVKRILSEARELSADPSTEYTAAPLEDNIFEWHYTLRGPSGTEFEKGIYHGRILLPAEYPFRPPHLMVLTPNGRWECGKKICLTFTGFHEEMWQPAWGIRTALLGIQTFMSARAEAAAGVGSLEYPREQREKLAEISRDWKCPTCNKTNAELIPAPPEGNDDGERKVEQLPEGLSVDFSGKKTEQASGSSQADGGGSSERQGEQVVETKSVAEPSSEPESKPTPESPAIGPSVDDGPAAPAPPAGTGLVPRSVASAAAVPAPGLPAPTLANPPPPPQAAPQPIAPGLVVGTSPSERYLAVLDRAIATVVLLLGALLVRMLLL